MASLYENVRCKDLEQPNIPNFVISLYDRMKAPTIEPVSRDALVSLPLVCSYHTFLSI
jgi:hypothetical protein